MRSSILDTYKWTGPIVGVVSDVDVVIVGAGPTGLTLACDLTRRGVRCRVVEQAAEPARGSRGFTLKPRTLEAFDDLGIAGRVMAVATIEGRIRFHLGTERLFDLRVPPAPANQARPYPNPVALPQWRTEAILRDRLTELGGTVEFGRPFTSFTQDDDGVRVVAGGATIRARYLVGADGGRSRVRHGLGLSFTGSTAEDTRALIADVHVEGLDREAGVHLWMTADGHLVAARPIRHSDLWQVVTSLEPGADAALDTVQRTVTARTGRDLRVTDPSWLSVWRYNLRMVDRYRVGRVFLAGDAAHVHSPFGGHGMNTGIQDAYNLGWKLAMVLDGAADSLLDTYETERLPVARTILADSDRRMSATVPPRAVRPLVRLVLKPFFARQQRRTRDDHPTYRDSPLSTHRASRRGRHAGDVAPDAPVTIDGRPARLFDVLRGPHVTVLTFGPNGSVHAGETNRLADPTGALRRTYGARPGTTVVIRPDGYLGLIAHAPCDDAVADYLRRIGLHRTEPSRPAFT